MGTNHAQMLAAIESDHGGGTVIVDVVERFAVPATLHWETAMLELLGLA